MDSISKTVDKQTNTLGSVSAVKFSEILEFGGIYQINHDLFLLFTGLLVPSNKTFNDLTDRFVFYQPRFWDILQNNSQGLFHEQWHSKEEFIISRTELAELISRSLGGGLGGDFSGFQIQGDIEGQKDDFKNQFDWSQAQFQNKKLLKTVPMTNFKFEVNESISVIQILKNILILNSKDTSIYGQWNKEKGFIGMSPETLGLWSYEPNQMFSTMALAGTWGHQAQIENYNQVDLKTKNEHQIVVDDITERLKFQKRFFKEETHIVKLPHLSHLKTNLHCRVDDAEKALRLISDLHPTAALGIFPRNAEMNLQFSGFDAQKNRQHFGAPWVMMNKNFCKSIVTIRQLQWDKEKIQIPVGCGITFESQFGLEWQELITKRNSVIKYLGIDQIS